MSNYLNSWSCGYWKNFIIR